MTSPRFSDQTADRILRRAIELADTRSGSTTLTDLRDSAQQLGIPPEYVDRAVEEALEGRVAAAPPVTQHAEPAPSSQRWLSQLARHAVVGLCAIPALAIANRFSFTFPWQYHNSVEGLTFGALLLVIARVVKAPVALVIAAYLMLVHLALVITTLRDDRGYGLYGGAPIAAALAAALAGGATALWFTSRRRAERRALAESGKDARRSP
ncbi:MAG: hypothetical protein IPK85_00240 [Gemmatimonadetes bacterium]|nr:hypothetical protein [Gemmatimonadota bacterium]